MRKAVGLLFITKIINLLQLMVVEMLKKLQVKCSQNTMENKLSFCRKVEIWDSTEKIEFLTHIAVYAFF